MLTLKDSNQIIRDTHDENMNATRVLIVNGEMPVISSQIKTAPQEIKIEKIEVPVIVKEIQEIKIPEIVKEPFEVEKTIVVKEVQIEKIEVPVIVKEVQIVEIPKYITEYQVIEKPVIIEKTITEHKNMNLLYIINSVGIVLTLILLALK